MDNTSRNCGDASNLKGIVSSLVEKITNG